MALHGIEYVWAERDLGIRLNGLDLGAQVIGDGQLTLAQESLASGEGRQGKCSTIDHLAIF